MSLQTLVRAPNGDVAGIVEPTETKAIPRFNGRGTWQVTADRGDVPDELLQKGSSVVITDEYGHVISGPAYKYRIARGKDSTTAAVTVSGYSGEDYLARRRCFPDPANGPTTQTTGRHIITGVASTVLRTYVDLNVGPNALPDRRSGVVLGVDPVIGIEIVGSPRFHQLLDLVNYLANFAEIGFRVTQTLTGPPTFEVFQPRDLTSSIRLSHGMLSLISSDYSLTAPDATYMITGGQGELTSRLFKVAVDSGAEAAWGDRYEGFHDSGSEDDPVKLQQDADAELEKTGETGQVSFEPLDTPDIQIRRDYWLGDKISIEIEPGVRVAEVIREVEVTHNVDGTTYLPRAGDTNATATPAERRAIHDALERLSALETGR